MRDGYAVIVTHLGEPILTIERTMLAGKSDLSSEDREAIRDAGDRLRSFVGGEVICSVCGVRRQCDDSCPSRDVPF